jgi:long-chain acyl-CoA synthetase
MTETNAYGPQNGGEDLLARPRSTGRPVPVLEVRVVDDQGREVPRGEVGEICFRGAPLIRGYWGKPEATAETIVDGWLHSGDLGRVDEEGFVYVEDRLKDMVLRGGENVYCAEVEAAIYEHPAVYEAAVFGLPHERLGEEVAAVVMRRGDSELDADSLEAYLRERLAVFKLPTVIDITDAQLPRNASGKILKRTLRDRLTERLGRSS